MGLDSPGLQPSAATPSCPPLILSRFIEYGNRLLWICFCFQIYLPALKNGSGNQLSFLQCFFIPVIFVMFDVCMVTALDDCQRDSESERNVYLRMRAENNRLMYPGTNIGAGN